MEIPSLFYGLRLRSVQLFVNLIAKILHSDALTRGRQGELIVVDRMKLRLRNVNSLHRGLLSALIDFEIAAVAVMPLIYLARIGCKCEK